MTAFKKRGRKILTPELRRAILLLLELKQPAKMIAYRIGVSAKTIRRAA